jgi:nucleotide-binding universal stress UspA family protein
MKALPKRVLLATDGSEDATMAARVAGDLAERSGSELHLVHVGLLPHWMEPDTPAAPRYKTLRQEARKLLETETERITATGATVAGSHLRMGFRADEKVIELAEELDADLVVVGSRGLGPVRRLVVGSVSGGVVHHSSRPILVVRGGEQAWPPERVVVGDDSTEEARRAGELAAGVARFFGARVVLARAYPVILTISEASRVSEAAAPTAAEALRRHAANLERRARGLEADLGYRPLVRLREGEAAEVLLEEAEGGAGPALVAVGSGGLGTLDRLRLGSISTRVLRAAECPVLVVPRPDQAGGEGGVEGMPSYSRLLVATDGSLASLRAGRHAVYLAKKVGAKLFVLGVPGTDRAAGGISGASSGAVGEATREIRDLAAKAGVPSKNLSAQGEANRTLDDAAEEVGADLVVLGRAWDSARKILNDAPGGALDDRGRPVLLVGRQRAAQAAYEEHDRR